MAMKHDIILVAGKGHETYQEINGVKNEFDDRVVLGEMIDLVYVKIKECCITCSHTLTVNTT
jgi:hypothetical protein